MTTDKHTDPLRVLLEKIVDMDIPSGNSTVKRMVSIASMALSRMTYLEAKVAEQNDQIRYLRDEINSLEEAMTVLESQLLDLES